MKNSTPLHGFAVSGKDREKDRAFIVHWLGPIIAWLVVLVIGFAAIGALLGQR